MATVFLVISAVLFIGTFGIHMMIQNGPELNKPMYTHNPVISVVPILSGFVFPVIPWTLIFESNWFAILIINFAVVFFLGPILTKGLLVRFASGKGLGQDMLYCFVGGVVSLVLGLLTR